MTDLRLNDPNFNVNDVELPRPVDHAVNFDADDNN